MITSSVVIYPPFGTDLARMKSFRYGFIISKSRVPLLLSWFTSCITFNKVLSVFSRIAFSP